MFEVFSKDFENLNWKQVHRRFGKEYAEVLSLFDLMLINPATSTTCERGFPQMKLIKSDRRTLISEKTLSNSLMIKLEGPTIQEFNSDSTIDLWFNKCKRRPGTSGSLENKLEMDEATAGLSVVDETYKDIEQDEEHVEDIPNDNHDVVGHGAMYELVQQPMIATNSYLVLCKFSTSQKELLLDSRGA